MARMVTRDSYTPAPVGAVGFDEEADEIKRQRARVEALLSSKQAEKLPGWKGAAAQTILAIARGYNDKTLGDKEQALAQRRAAAANEWLKQEPQDIPAVEEQVGTGPLAPPPGTPGVEQAMPPAPAGEADVMPMPSSNNMTPDSPAGWVGPGNALDMLPRGMTGADYKPNVAGSPMVPRDIRDVGRWAMQGAGFSPVHEAIAKTSYQRALDQPEKARLAKEAIQAKKDAADAAALQRKHEKEIADANAKQAAAYRAAESQAAQERGFQNQKELRAIISADQESRAAALAADKEAAAAADTKAATKKAEADQKEITAHIAKYGEAIKKEKLPSLETALTNVIERVDAIRAKNNGEIPGVGYLANIPGTSGFYDDDVKQLKGAITDMRNSITVARAGLSQTAAEMRNVLEELGLKWWSPEQDFINALPRLRQTLEARKENLRATYRPEAIEIYHKRIDERNAKLRSSNTPGAADDGWAVREKK